MGRKSSSEFSKRQILARAIIRPVTDAIAAYPAIALEAVPDGLECMRLWEAVLYKAAMDAFQPKPDLSRIKNPKDRKQRMVEHELEVFNAVNFWTDVEQLDNIVCHFGVSAERMKKRFLRAQQVWPKFLAGELGKI